MSLLDENLGLDQRITDAWLMENEWLFMIDAVEAQQYYVKSIVINGFYRYVYYYPDSFPRISKVLMLGKSVGVYTVSGCLVCEHECLGQNGIIRVKNRGELLLNLEYIRGKLEENT